MSTNESSLRTKLDPVINAAVSASEAISDGYARMHQLSAQLNEKLGLGSINDWTVASCNLGETFIAPLVATKACDAYRDVVKAR